MNDDFKPSTRRLLALMGWNTERFKSAKEEDYLIHRIVIDIGNRTYVALGEDRYRNEVWPVDPSLKAGLREALREHYPGYAGEDLAFLLMRAGADDPYVLEKLHPTDRVLYRWIEQGLSARSAAEIWRDAGLIDSVEQADLARLDGWLANPLTALHEFNGILDALFGKASRLVYAGVRDPGFEFQHDELLRQLLASAVPSIVVEELSQSGAASEPLIDVTESTHLVMQTADGPRTYRVGDDPQLSQEGVRVYQHDGRCIVRFKYAGKPHGVFVESQGTWMDVSAVLKGADAFLADIGRPERVFQFAVRRGDSGEWLVFLVADPAKFLPAAQRLGLPLAEP